MFENQERTNIEQLGEFGLIDHLTKQIKIKNTSTVKGIGDDAAVIDFEGKKMWLKLLIVFSFHVFVSDVKAAGGKFDGVWNSIKPVPGTTFSLSLKQTDNKLIGQYCAVARSGGRIDCEEGKDRPVRG